jgi:hypothetical protein
LSRRTLLTQVKGLAYATLAIITAALPLPGFVVSRKLRQAVQGGPTPSNIQNINTIADLATRERINTDFHTAKATGLYLSNLVLQSQEPELAWSALRAISNYISFLNATRVSIPSKLTNARATRQITVPLDHFLHEKNKKETGALFIAASVDLVKDEQVGIIERLSDGHEFEKGPGVSAYVVSGSNGYFLLDGLYLRNVFFKEMPIVYRGAPVVLINVHFVDCTFLVEHTDACRMFLAAVSTDTKVNFNSSL